MNEGNAFCQASKNLLAGWSAMRTINARSARRLYPDLVVDGTLNPLFATEISFGGLIET